MPHTVSGDGARIHYEVHGDGDPVLLIMGLGSNAYGWWRTIPWLSERYEVIAFDNRGTGRSDVPDGPYEIEQMADDCVAVLDAVGRDRVHVVGASLGGMIAQRFVIAHPQRVRSLVLVCTRPGGERSIQPDPAVLEGLVAGGEDPAQVYRRNAWFLYAERTREEHPERIEEDLEYRGKIPTQPKGYLGQLQGAMMHDACDELPDLSVPTLVVHGTADLLIPSENGELLAKLIPGAELKLVEGAGHMLQADAPEEVREAVLSFLERV